MRAAALMVAFIRRFARARHGLAGVEFAMVAPLMISMYFAVTELTDAFSARSKVTTAVAAAADLVAQDQELEVTNDDIADIFEALDAVMFPYSAANTEIVISSLEDAGNNQVRVAWSEAHGGAVARTVGDIVTIPPGLVVSGGNGSVIFAEITHSYTSPAGHLIYGSIDLTDEFFARPRRGAKIKRVS